MLLDEVLDMIFKLQVENKRLKQVLEAIKYSVKSCRAGDGDKRTWEQCAIDCETLAEEGLCG